MARPNNLELYNKMQEALEKDKMYWFRNEAKLRAVVSSKSYDEFKDIVAAAHLNPISRKNLMEKKQVNWNKAFK